jgi:hypothetical protein
MFEMLKSIIREYWYSLDEDDKLFITPFYMIILSGIVVLIILIMK